MYNKNVNSTQIQVIQSNYNCISQQPASDPKTKLWQFQLHKLKPSWNCIHWIVIPSSRGKKEKKEYFQILIKFKTAMFRWMVLCVSGQWKRRAEKKNTGKQYWQETAVCVFLIKQFNVSFSSEAFTSPPSFNGRFTRKIFSVYPYFYFFYFFTPLFL